MRYGIDPATGAKIDALNYQQSFGARGTNNTKPSQINCPHCGDRVFYRAGRCIPHFSHSGDRFCITKAPAAELYLDLSRAQFNPAAGAARRTFVKNNWRIVYRQIEAIVPYLHINEFQLLLETAADKRAFDLVGLQDKDIVPMLVCFRDYSATTGYPAGVRSSWYRFWFKGLSGRINNLWITQSRGTSLMRSEYRQPTPPMDRPASSDIVGSLPVTVPSMPIGSVSMPSYLISRMDEWFAKHPSF